MRTFTWTKSLKDNNQDAVGSGSRFVAVADGATPLEGSKAKADATAAFSSALVRGLERNEVRPDGLRDGISEAVEYAQRDCEVAGVTSTLTVATWDENVLRIATIGDCTALLLTSTGWQVVIDPNYEGNEKRYLGRVANSVRHGASWKDAYASINADLEQGRKARNTDRGTWIVSDSVDANKVMDHFHIVSVPRTCIKACLVLSDGANAWRDPFQLVDAGDLVASSALDLDSYWEQANQMQREDADRSRFPRLSNLDDATVARVIYS